MPHPVRSVAIDTKNTPLAAAFDSVALAQEECPAGDIYGPQTLTALGIFFTQSGEATVVADGKNTLHRPGSLVVLAPGQTICETVGAASPWTVRYLLLGGPWAQALAVTLWERARGGVGVAVYDNTPVNPPAPWQPCLNAVMKQGFSQGDGWQWRFLSECAALFDKITCCPAVEGQPDDLRDQLERLFDAAPERLWSVDEAARALKIPSRPLRYRFQKLTGVRSRSGCGSGGFRRRGVCCSRAARSHKPRSVSALPIRTTFRVCTKR